MSQQHRKDSWQTMLAVGSLVATLVMLAVVNRAVTQREQIQEQADMAGEQARSALARQLGAQAQSLSLLVNPKYETAFLLAIQSMRLMPTGDAAQVLLESPIAHPVTLMDFDSPVSAMAFSHDGKFMATGHADNTLRVWETATDQEIFRGAQEAGSVFLAFSPNADYLVASTGWEINSVHVWEISTGKELVNIKYENFSNYVTFVAISPDGKFMVPLISNDNSISMLDLKTGTEAFRFSHGDAAFDGAGCVSFSPSGKYVLSCGGRENMIRVWDTATGNEVIHMIHGDGLFSASFSPDEKYILSASENTARVWDTLTGHEVSRMTHDGYSYHAAFSPDGKLVASGGYDGTVRIWEAATGRELLRMPLEKYLWRVVFSSNGKYLLTIEGGNIVPVAHVWDVNTGREIARIRRVDIESIRFSPDDNALRSITTEGTVREWQLLPERLIADACAISTRNLTRLEWNLYVGDALPYQAVCPGAPIELTPPDYSKLILTLTPTPKSTP